MSPHRIGRGLRLAAVLAPLVAASCPASRAAVEVIEGPTPIEGGEARAATDITVRNERLAFALAVGTSVPYGVARGAIIDVAPVANGRVGRDCVVFADFIPNDWSAWPNSYSRVHILERGPERAVVRVERDWGKVAVTTTYVLEAGSDSVRMETELANHGPALGDLQSGPTLWPRRGFFQGLPGVSEPRRGGAAQAFEKRVVAYDEDWAVSLHAPAADRFDDGGMDLLTGYSLAAGATHRSVSWLQVGASGDLAPVVAEDIRRERRRSGSVHGTVMAGDGTPVDKPVLVALRDGKLFAWFFGDKGRYSVTLPVGDYELYATAKNSSESARRKVRVSAGGVQDVAFGGIGAPGRVDFAVSDANDAPVDARITILAGQAPLVQFLGRRTFFTELDAKGKASVPIAPGTYRFAVSAGGDFLSARRELDVRVDPGRDARARVTMAPSLDPAARHWYSADLHHHSDQAEAVTPPADLARSQLAAGLDVLFVSDHDSGASHAALAAIAARRGMPFIPGVELSPSWGHFNAYPVQLGQGLRIDTSTASVAEIFREARRLGATVIQANHPFIPYGYYTSVASGAAPGGFDPDFDLLEINAEEHADDDKVLRAAWSSWSSWSSPGSGRPQGSASSPSAARRYYLSAGTDTHDVWQHESGRVRVFAHLAALSAPAFVEALAHGHSYVSYGPLIYPSVVPGDTVPIKAGAPLTLDFDLESVAGLKRAELVERGEVKQTRNWRDSPVRTRASFIVRTTGSTWFSLDVEDSAGRRAFTNPIWVSSGAPARAAGDSARP